MEKVSIKVLPHPENDKLSAKYINSNEYIMPGIGEDGKTITGLDELAVDVLRIEDPKERKKTQDSIKKEREELERLLGRDLSPTSEFWDDFYVVLNDEVVLEPSNPMHRLLERFLIANKKVAPSFEATRDDERFLNCVFYIYREVEETSKAAKKQRDLDKVTAKLFIIAEENPKKLVTLYSYLFGYEATGDILPDTAYLKIKELVEVKDEKDRNKNIKKIIDALELKPEEVQTKLILDKAIKKKIVTAKGGIYRRGDQVFGNDYDEALAYLLSAENSSELISLKKEADK
jgi:hypothetical protein